MVVCSSVLAALIVMSAATMTPIVILRISVSPPVRRASNDPITRPPAILRDTEPPLHPDHGHRMPRTAARRRHPALVERSRDGVGRHAGKLGQDRAQRLVALGSSGRVLRRQHLAERAELDAARFAAKRRASWFPRVSPAQGLSSACGRAGGSTARQACGRAGAAIPRQACNGPQPVRASCLASGDGL